LVIIWVVLAVAVATCAVIYGKLAHIRSRDGLFWCAWWNKTDLYEVKCGDCGGLGVVWLHGKVNKEIPPGNRDRRVGSSRFYPRLANARNCRSCGGMGFKWVAQPASWTAGD
jgi:hypothetical protein